MTEETQQAPETIDELRSTELAVSRDQAIQDVANILYMEPADLDPSMDLADQGMDSVRMMQLVETWRSAGVDQVDFIVLAQDQRLEAWLEQLQHLQTA